MTDAEKVADARAQIDRCQGELDQLIANNRGPFDSVSFQEYRAAASKLQGELQSHKERLKQLLSAKNRNSSPSTPHGCNNGLGPPKHFLGQTV